MKLTDVIDQVILDSGQFIVGDISLINFDINKFNTICKRALAFYGKYKPKTKLLYVTTYNGSHTFLDDIPSWISSARNVEATMLPAIFQNRNNINLNDTIYGPWRYDKPIFYTSQPGRYEITGVYDLGHKEIRDDKNNLIDVELEDLDLSDARFLDLMRGYFLQSLGRSRRGFTLQDFPVQLDADQMIAEGNDLVKDAEEGIKENSYWHLAVGG